jgi:ribosomal protein L29
MAIIKKKELKNMEEKELIKKMEELKMELLKTRSQKASHGGPKKTKEIKRTIARINTQLNQIQLKNKQTR